jgi:hypothetical protein
MDFNYAPVVNGIDATPNAEVAVGSPILFTVDATDGGGDKIGYEWQASCPGSFVRTDILWLDQNTFIPSAAGPCTFTVKVADHGVDGAERGAVNQGTLEFNVVNPADVVAVGPQFYVYFASPMEMYSGQVAEVQVIASDAQVHPNWTAVWSDGGMGGTFTPWPNGYASGSDMQYTPPACSVLGAGV